MQKTSGVDSCHNIRMEGGDWFLIIIDWVNWLSFSKDSGRVVLIATYRALLSHHGFKGRNHKGKVYTLNICVTKHTLMNDHTQKHNLSDLQQVTFLCKKRFKSIGNRPLQKIGTCTQSIIPSKVRQTKTNIIGCYLYVESKNIIQWP